MKSKAHESPTRAIPSGQCPRARLNLPKTKTSSRYFTTSSFTLFEAPAGKYFRLKRLLQSRRPNSTNSQPEAASHTNNADNICCNLNIAQADPLGSTFHRIMHVWQNHSSTPTDRSLSQSRHSTGASQFTLHRSYLPFESGQCLQSCHRDSAETPYRVKWRIQSYGLCIYILHMHAEPKNGPWET